MVPRSSQQCTAGRDSERKQNQERFRADVRRTSFSVRTVNTETDCPGKLCSVHLLRFSDLTGWRPEQPGLTSQLTLAWSRCLDRQGECLSFPFIHKNFMLAIFSATHLWKCIFEYFMRTAEFHIPGVAPALRYDVTPVMSYFSHNQTHSYSFWCVETVETDLFIAAANQKHHLYLFIGLTHFPDYISRALLLYSYNHRGSVSLWINT